MAGARFMSHVVCAISHSQEKFFDHAFMLVVYPPAQLLHSEGEQQHSSSTAPPGRAASRLVPYY
jgi:hypothetical protein